MKEHTIEYCNVVLPTAEEAKKCLLIVIINGC